MTNNFSYLTANIFIFIIFYFYFYFKYSLMNLMPTYVGD